jgi:hypothetical protein
LKERKKEKYKQRKKNTKKERKKNTKKEGRYNAKPTQPSYKISVVQLFVLFVEFELEIHLLKKKLSLLIF